MRFQEQRQQGVKDEGSSAPGGPAERVGSCARRSEGHRLGYKPCLCSALPPPQPCPCPSQFPALLPLPRLAPCTPAPAPPCRAPSPWGWCGSQAAFPPALAAGCVAGGMGCQGSDAGPDPRWRPKRFCDFTKQGWTGPPPERAAQGA